MTITQTPSAPLTNTQHPGGRRRRRYDRPVTRMRKPFAWFELRRQMMLLLDAATDDVRAALPRLHWLRDGQELVLLDRIGSHTVLLGYDPFGSYAHWASTEDIASGYTPLERHAQAAA